MNHILKKPKQGLVIPKLNVLLFITTSSNHGHEIHKQDVLQQTVLPGQKKKLQPLTHKADTAILLKTQGMYSLQKQS